MTLQDIGSIGELIGGIATVATLAYLAIQIRANTRVAKAESRRSNFTGVGANLAPIIESEEVARILVQGLTDKKSLSLTEGLRFSMLLNRFLAGAQLAYYERLEGVAEDHEGQHVENVMSFLRAPGGADWWQASQGNYREEFRGFVNQLLSQPH